MGWAGRPREHWPNTVLVTSHSKDLGLAGDNLIMREWNFKGIDLALKSLAWFWIPAHTLTFALPPAFQIGLAALWGVVLGFILGFAKNKAAAQEMGLAPAVN